MVGTYKKLVEKLIEKYKEIYEGLVNKEQEIWAKQIPEDIKLNDIAKLEKLFDREECNKKYAELLHDPNAEDGIKQVIMLKIQAAMLASWQQGYNYRYNRRRLEDVADTAARFKAYNKHFGEEIYNNEIVQNENTNKV